MRAVRWALTPQRRLVAAVPLIIGLGLLVDQFAGPWGQPFVSAVAWLAFFLILKSESRETRGALLLCLLLATLGEVVLSLVWGLYDYRLGNVPLFVPPGHVLLFWFGTRTVSKLPAWLLDASVVASGIGVGALAIASRDWLSVPLWGLFAACWYFGPARRFYAWMFLLALAMEIYATQIGNWAWRPAVPGLGVPTMNPPLAAGAFYCVLDVLVFSLCAAWARRAGARAQAAAATAAVQSLS